MHLVSPISVVNIKFPFSSQTAGAVRRDCRGRGHPGRLQGDQRGGRQGRLQSNRRGVRGDRQERSLRGQGLPRHRHCCCAHLPAGTAPSIIIILITININSMSKYNPQLSIMRINHYVINWMHFFSSNSSVHIYQVICSFSS